MSTVSRLAAFAAVLAAMLAGGWAAGAALEPLGSDTPRVHSEHTP